MKSTDRPVSAFLFYIVRYAEVRWGGARHLFEYTAEMRDVAEATLVAHLLHWQPA